MKLFIALVIAVSIFINVGCDFDRNTNSISKYDTVYKINGNPEKGFNYSYFLYLPKNIVTDREINLIVQTNNTGFPNDTLTIHEKDARKIATNSFYIGNYISCNMGMPLLVPVFPRPLSDWRIYTHALDRDAVLISGEMARLDLQLIEMVVDAQQRLQKLGIRVDKKIVLTGFSASGTFANRFTTIHPEYVAACACGGINAMPVLPLDVSKGYDLKYPVGIFDFEELFNKKFDFSSYSEVPQYLFMGENDKNDAVQFNDGYSDEDREIIPVVLGNTMIPERWISCERIFKMEDVNAVFITYKNRGHNVDKSIKNDIVKFFKTVLKSNNNKQ